MSSFPASETRTLNVAAEASPLSLPDNGTPEEFAALGFDRSQIAVINGMVKPNAALFTDNQYRRHVREFVDGYLTSRPRRITSS